MADTKGGIIMKIHRIIAYLLKIFTLLFRKTKTDVYPSAKGVRLVTSDGYVITDINGTILTITEDK